MEEKEKKILSRLQTLCVRREYCESDMYAKALKAVEGNEQLAAELLQSLVQDRFVSNLRYASAYAREKASIAGWGPVKIGHLLAAKGISRSIISEALEEIDRNSADARLERLLTAKYRTLADDPQGKLKLLRFALGRGYRYEEVKELVEKVIHNCK